MLSPRQFSIGLPAVFAFHLAIVSQAGSVEPAAIERLDGQVAKQVLAVQESDENLLRPDAWRPWQTGFDRDGQAFVCDNGSQGQVQRGASQTVVLNQTRPEPIIAVAWSKAEAVTGTPDSDYALYLDLVYTDGTSLWGQTAPFATGTHDWQRRQVIVFPERPVRSLAVHLLLRNHGGKAWFRDPALRVMSTPQSACRFDGVPVLVQDAAQTGFQVRDVAAGSDFVRIEHQALGLQLDWKQTEQNGAMFVDAEVRDTTARDRAITLIYSLPVEGDSLRWWHDPRSSEPVQTGREYLNATQFRAGLGRLSRYPLAAVTDGQHGAALGIDPERPAFFRAGYNAGSRELFLAYDIGLSPEKPVARIRLCRYTFDPNWGFRAALARYYELFPEAFRCRTPQQGLWMPFARISKVEGWEDFGFKFKEGNDETAWDDAHGIFTFRYTEPMTWWMTMPAEMPRTIEAAVAEARRRAEQQRDRQAQALLSSGYHNAEGQFPARLLDTPWCNGAVWSMNSMPGIAGEVTDFNSKWNVKLREQLYGAARKGDLDGEYIDSSEGYVTDELDFRRDHLAASDTPLTFAPETFQPAIFRGLVAFEYVRGIAQDVHAMDKLMMANGAPGRLCWLPPLLEVLGTETDWNPGGKWRPMADKELLYQRALCKGKPFCFLMNTEFERFSPELVERYMQRSLAYGMFPGFFSHNASQGAYFTRPELYNRDRPLFKKYVPLCQRVAEAGWEPITRAHSSDERVYVERFGDRYLTVFNDSPESRTATIRLDTPAPAASRELVAGTPVTWTDGATTLTLAGEHVAVIDLGP
jgi:hypothetical protein